MQRGRECSSNLNSCRFAQDLLTLLAHQRQTADESTATVTRILTTPPRRHRPAAGSPASARGHVEQRPEGRIISTSEPDTGPARSLDKWPFTADTMKYSRWVKSDTSDSGGELLLKTDNMKPESSRAEETHQATPPPAEFLVATCGTPSKTPTHRRSPIQNTDVVPTSSGVGSPRKRVGDQTPSPITTTATLTPQQ